VEDREDTTSNHASLHGNPKDDGKRRVILYQVVIILCSYQSVDSNVVKVKILRRKSSCFNVLLTPYVNRAFV
jgi:hypothetical protein